MSVLIMSGFSGLFAILNWVYGSFERLSSEAEYEFISRPLSSPLGFGQLNNSRSEESGLKWPRPVRPVLSAPSCRGENYYIIHITFAQVAHKVCTVML